ncbi:unnamed protein product [Rotaria socialis]|uniref:DNA polymerase eta n=1 Tax=Rotaria socialis TaxID=392032 RepID=A0A821F9S5_9BILA|nr:unnamed protein product [Rotaria socialis]
MNSDHRVIALIDMDCFYVQVEQRLQPEFLGKPCGVAQYYTWKGGGLIAVNYEARDFGVKRGEQAKELCPDFHVFHVQEVNGKANLTRNRRGYQLQVSVSNVHILVRGIETAPVNSRNLYKSISASKNFPGKSSLDTLDKIRTWCHNLAEEVFNRLEKDRAENKRRAKLLTVTCTLNTNETIARSCPINEYSIDRFANDTFRILKQFNKSPASSNIYTPAIISFGIGAGKFLENANTKSIVDLFSKQTTKTETIKPTENTTRCQEYEDYDDDDDDGSNSEDKILQKSTVTVPIQGDFFRKFQKTDEQIKPRPKSETKTTSSIVSFFSRYASNENIPICSPEKSSEHCTTCSKCQKSILVWNMPEHEDFHYAHELQMEENRSNSMIAPPPPPPATTKISKPVKRKNEKQKSNIQTLDSFVNKKPKTE